MELSNRLDSQKTLYEKLSWKYHEVGKLCIKELKSYELKSPYYMNLEVEYEVGKSIEMRYTQLKQNFPTLNFLI